MSFSERYIKLAQQLLPSPFTIAVLLSMLTFVLALLLTGPDTANLSGEENRPYALQLLSFWENGIWNRGGMVFTLQMMLILVLGHTLALTPVVSQLIDRLLFLCKSTASAAATVVVLALAVAWINWGLGLIFGAIFARKVGEHARDNNIALNYPLIGAAGYAGLMIWHGGLSGSAPITVAEPGHNLEAQIGLVPMAQTVFSGMNLTALGLMLIAMPVFCYWLGKRVQATGALPQATIDHESEREQEVATGAEKLDRAAWLAYLFGGVLLLMAAIKFWDYPDKASLGFIVPNFINLCLFAGAILLHGRFDKFLQALNQAISGATGILIQFPLYFGIMGMVKGSGMLEMLSSFFVRLSGGSETVFPLLTLLSAGLVNIFVPSGGGQWQVQGPIIIDAAREIGVSDWKAIMALAYGDQLTNMLQPFWALPLLGITGLKAKEILPYTLIFMLIGAAIFGLVLTIF